MSELLLDVQNLWLERSRKTLLQEISFDLHQGQILTLIGPNGAGKTSLVRLVLGLYAPSRGKLWRKKNLRIGYLPQRLQPPSNMPLTVAGFLSLTANPQKLNTAIDEAAIGELQDRPLSVLSGGEWQRVLLARALLRDPELLVLDEPAQGVDINGQVELYQRITAIRDRHGCAVLLVSHDLHFVMATTDEVLCLNRHLCCHGHPLEVSKNPAYQQLFSQPEREILALYRHQHDHQHQGSQIVQQSQQQDHLCGKC